MVKIMILLTVLSLKIVSIQSEQFGLFPGILGEPRRRWHPYFEPQLNHMMQINEQMLTTYVLIHVFTNPQFSVFDCFFANPIMFAFFIYFYSYMKIHLDQIKSSGKFCGEKNQVSKIQNS